MSSRLSRVTLGALFGVVVIGFACRRAPTETPGEEPEPTPAAVVVGDGSAAPTPVGADEPPDASAGETQPAPAPSAAREPTARRRPRARRPRPSPAPTSQPPAEAGGDPEPGRLAGITAAHNKVRKLVASPPLEWSESLARYAAEWAGELKRRGCQLDHRPNSGRFAQKYGENLFWIGGTSASSIDVVDSWTSEAQFYDARTNRCSRVCGHFTQVAWKSSRQLGCAVVRCEDKGAEVWVCNYDPPGNFIGQRPF